jgi:4,5-DOPA dioxygenase extradiol
MDRKDFLKLVTLLPFTGAAMKLNAFNTLADLPQNGHTMPVLFLGHGNPMNAIQENEYTRAWRAAGASMPKPVAILCVSAHWETRGTLVTAMPAPKTIHDFGGFPKELSEFQYAAPGSPALAEEAKKAVSRAEVGLDYEWGLDHGCWSVVCHLFPDAGIPVIQMSLDYTKPPAWHYELGRELAALRRKGVLIVGSGNIVHNLGMLSWNSPRGYDWAIEANEKVKKLILAGDHRQLIGYPSLGKEMQLAVPSPEHYLPLLYTLALKEEKDSVSFFNDRTEMGAVSMTSVRIGAA